MENAGTRLYATFHADWPVRIPGDEEGDVDTPSIERSGSGTGPPAHRHASGVEGCRSWPCRWSTRCRHSPSCGTSRRRRLRVRLGGSTPIFGVHLSWITRPANGLGRFRHPSRQPTSVDALGVGVGVAVTTWHTYWPNRAAPQPGIARDRRSLRNGRPTWRRSDSSHRRSGSGRCGSSAVQAAGTRRLGAGSAAAGSDRAWRCCSLVLVGGRRAGDMCHPELHMERVMPACFNTLAETPASRQAA